VRFARCSIAKVALVSLLAGSCSSSGGTTSTSADGGQAQGGSSSAGTSGSGLTSGTGGSSAAGTSAEAGGSSAGAMGLGGGNAAGSAGEAGVGAGGTASGASGSGGVSGATGSSGAGGATGGAGGTAGFGGASASGAGGLAGASGSAGTSGTSGTSGSGGASGGSAGTGGGVGGSAGTGGAATVPPLYAHTDTTLFQLDPTNPALAPVALGDFDCIGGGGQEDTSMTDLAVDEAGALWGISAKNVHQLAINAGGPVHCSSTVLLVGTFAFFGLSFAPVGVIDASKEVLVAANTAGELWSIDSLGNVTERGTLGVVPSDDGHGHPYPAGTVGKPWELSGDIVFAANGGTPVGFANVRDCPNSPSTTACDTTDTLVEIDMSKLATAGTQIVTKAVRGLIVKSASCADASATGYGRLLGTAAWGSDIIGFARNGSIVRVSSVDGTGCLVASTSSLWAGAGITTLVPVIAPP
jgi:hypothetical protein